MRVKEKERNIRSFGLISWQRYAWVGVFGSFSCVMFLCVTCIQDHTLETHPPTHTDTHTHKHTRGSKRNTRTDGLDLGSFPVPRNCVKRKKWREQKKEAEKIGERSRGRKVERERKREGDKDGVERTGNTGGMSFAKFPFQGCRPVSNLKDVNLPVSMFLVFLSFRLSYFFYLRF